MFAYDAWATGATLTSIESVTVEKRSAPAFVRLVQIAAHIQVAKGVWMDRLHLRPPPARIEFFPSWSIEHIRETGIELERQWSSYLDAIHDIDLDNPITYTSSEGAKYESTVDEIMTHVVNHGTYHRGQIARLVSECGGQRASTDFILYTRRTL